MIEKRNFVNFLFLNFRFFIEICAYWLNLISYNFQFIRCIFESKQRLVLKLISWTIFGRWKILGFPFRNIYTLLNPRICIINEKHSRSRLRVWVSLFFNLKYFSIWLRRLSIFQIAFYSLALYFNLFFFLRFFHDNGLFRLERADGLWRYADFCLHIHSVIQITFALAEFFLYLKNFFFW